MSSALPTRESKADKVASHRPATVQPPPATIEKTQIVVDSIVTEVPFVKQADNGNFQDSTPSRRVDLGLITTEQLRKIKAIRRGYIAQGKLLANGQEVKSNRDALLCLVESLEV